MSEEQVESIFQHACEGAAESIGSTRTDWKRVADAIRELRSERDKARRALISAGYRYGTLNGAYYDWYHESTAATMGDIADVDGEPS